MTGAYSLHAAYQHILQSDGGSRIFHDFGLEVGRRYISPFRTDARKKNFSVFLSPKGDVAFKDFVSGDGGTFTALLHGFGYTTFEAQIQYAARLYGISLKEKGFAKNEDRHRSDGWIKHKRQERKDVSQAASSKKYRVTALELADFTPLELETLARISGGLITRSVLERFGLRALRSYTDEGVSEKGFAYGSTHEAKFTLVVPSADGNYYGYCYFGSDKHSPFPHRAKNFHLKLNEYTSELKFALGLNELRPNESTYLVEGIKDCLILLAKGYNAFTLGGVQHRLLPSVLERLHKNGNALTILFDTDFAGISAAQKLSATLSNSTVFAPLSKGERGIIPQNALSQYDAPIQHCICTLPRLERQETNDAPKPTHNDLADYVCLYGFDAELKNALLAPAPLRSITLAKSSVHIPAWQLAIKSKLSDEKPALKALTNLLDSASRLVLRAPTGCGKTYTVLRHIAPDHHRKTGGVTVLAVPTVAMAEQIKNEYRDLKPIVITGNESDLHRLYANAPLDTCVIVSVYDSAARLLDIISEPSTLLVVDEMHKLVSDYDYRTPAMRTMLRLIKQAPRTLCLSATPELLFHEAPLNFTYCDVNVEQKRPLRFRQCHYDKREEAVIDTILATLDQHPATMILLNVNSKKLLKRTKILLVKCGIAENDVDIVTRDTMATSPEYRSATEQSRFTRRVILTTNVLDCGVNILNTGRVQVIMLDEKNEDTIIQVANRFRMADTIDVVLFSSKKKGVSKQGLRNQAPRNQATKNQLPLFNERHHFLHTLLSAQMLAEAFNASTGRNHTADCGVGRKSTSRLQDTMIHFEHKQHQWSTDECAMMHRIHTLRLAMKTDDDVAKALESYGFVRIVDKAAPKRTALLSPECIDEVRKETRREALEDEETVLNLLHHKTAYFFAALNTLSRSKALKGSLPNVCPESLLPLMKQHPETTAILTNHAALLREQRTETLVRYYSEARTLGFDHQEALHLVRTNKDPRKWASFTGRLAIKQREAIHLAGMTDSILSKHDREKLRREEEIRRLIASTAEIGCALTSADGTQRHIPNAIRTKKEIADRANAYTGFMFRMTQQKAGELVEALFHVRYVRERVKTESRTHFSGHYAFDNDGTELKRKTLAEFVQEYGADGTKYAWLFMERVRKEARRYEETQERYVMTGECAGSTV